MIFWDFRDLENCALRSLEYCPSKNCQNWSLFGPIFCTFSTTFHENPGFYPFSAFSAFSEISDTKAFSHSGTPKVPHMGKWEKSMFLPGQNVVPQGWQKSEKNGRCRNAYPNPEGGAKSGKTGISRKPGKVVILGKHRKVMKITDFRTFSSRRGFAFPDRVLVGFLTKVSILTRINGGFTLKSVVFWSKKGSGFLMGFGQNGQKPLKYGGFSENYRFIQPESTLSAGDSTKNHR